MKFVSHLTIFADGGLELIGTGCSVQPSSCANSHAARVWLASRPPRSYAAS